MNLFDHYHELAARLLGKDDIPLPLPNWDRNYPHNIGLLSDAEESALAAAVLQLTQGMSYESWKHLDMEQRVPWMQQAVSKLGDSTSREGLSKADVLSELVGRVQAGVPIVSADEVAKWPNGLLDALAAEGVLTVTDNATSFACDSCGHDHVETVEYIESPPGSGLRAYISCPENGRVRVPLSRLRRWIVNREKLPVPKDREPDAEAGSKSKKGGRRDGVPKRSWTQSDLDNAIREYKSQRASRYGDLVDGVKHGQPGATKAARELFGRNVIVRELGVRSPAMVTNSSAWQEIADELGLRDRVGKKRRAPAQRIGIEIAQEEHAVATGESVVDQVVRRETIALVERSMPALEAEATVEKLQRGEITDDQARELVDVSADQKQDDRTRRVRQGL